MRAQSDNAVRLGPFRLDAPVARGGMGEVWRGVHEPQQIPVAVKVLPPDRVTSPSAARALRIEVEAAARLDHPNVARMLDLGVVDAAAQRATKRRLTAGTPYLAMAWASGGNVDSRCGRVGWPEIRRILVAVLDALACAHAHGLLHLDVKPSNLLVNGDGEIVLADFGLAVLRDGHDGVRGGSPGYAAPEQFTGRPSERGPWTDLYALGATALALSRGHPEWRPATTTLPSGFDDWVARLMAERPSDRFRCAADARYALTRLVDPPVAATEPAPDDAEESTLTAWSSLEWEPRPAAVAPIAPLAIEEPPPIPPSWRDSVRHRDDRPLFGVGLGLYGLREPGLLGREAERDQLWRVLHACATEGRVHVAVLHGPAGTGKTRLARWLTTTAHAVGGLPHLLVEHEPEPAGRTGLSALITRDVADAAGLPAPEQHARLWRHVRGLAHDRPAIVWIDDAQWGFEALQWVERVLCWPAQAPVMVVLTVRDDALTVRPLEAARVAALETDERVHAVAVEPLRSADGRRLVQSLLGLAPPLAAHVVERTDGNPLFAVELVGHWVRADLLASSDDGFRLRDDGGDVVPVDLAAVWAERIAHALAGAPAAWTGPLEIAAFLGHHVDDDEWARACAAAGQDAPEGLVTRLLAHRLVRQERSGWRFVHGMLREALVVRATTEGRAPAWHGACAVALAEVGDAAAERRGWHRLHAGETALAIPDLLDGARIRINAGAPDQAEAIVELVEAADAGAHAAVLAVLRAQIAHRRGDRAGMETRARAAATLALEADDADLGCLALVMVSVAARMSGATEEADRALTRAEALLGRIADPRLVARIRKERASWLHGLGRYDEASRLLERALDVRPDDGALWEDLAMVERARGDRSAMGRALVRARAAYVKKGQRWQELAVLNALGDLARHGGDGEAAAAHYAEAMAGMDDAGSPFAVVPLLNLGMLRAEQGDDAAAALFRDGLARATSLGRRDLLAFAHLGLAARGTTDAADRLRHLRAAREAIDGLRLVDVDLLRLAEAAVRACREAGDADGAALAEAIARDQRSRGAPSAHVGRRP